MTACSLTPSAPEGGAAMRLRGRRTRRLMAAVVVAAAGLCLFLTGCTVTATGRPAAAPDLGHWQPLPILNPHLGDLLLSAADVNAVGHTAGMMLRTPLTKMGHAEGLVSNPS